MSVIRVSAHTQVSGSIIFLGALLYGLVIPKQSLLPSREDRCGHFGSPSSFFFMWRLKTQLWIGSMEVWMVVRNYDCGFDRREDRRYDAPARGCKHTWKDSMMLGGLMNLQGPYGSYCLEIVLAGGIISSVAFSAMIMMASQLPPWPTPCAYSTSAFDRFMETSAAIPAPSAMINKKQS